LEFGGFSAMMGLKSGTAQGTPGPINHAIPVGVQIGVSRVPIPTRNGFIFTGWLHADGRISTREQVGAIVVTHTGTLTAGWERLHNVQLFRQGSYPLCWAYAQVMVEAFRSGRTWTQAQASARARELAREVHGPENYIRGGWPTNRGTRLANIRDFDALFRALENGPLYAYYWNGLQAPNARAHLVVVTGINSAQRTVRTNNPWGHSGWQSFEDFLLRCLGDSGNGMPLSILYTIR